MQECANVWVIRVPALAVTLSTPKIAVQYEASSTNTAEILYFSASQSASTTSAMEQIQLTRLSAAATVTAGTKGGASGSVFDYSGGGSNFRGTLATNGTGITGTTTGTQTDTVVLHNFNVLGGYEWNSQPNMRIFVPASGLIGLELQGIVAGTWAVAMVVREF